MAVEKVIGTLTSETTAHKPLALPKSAPVSGLPLFTPSEETDKEMPARRVVSMHMSPRLIPSAILLLTASLHAADPKRIPPPGVAIPDTDRTELTASADALGREIASLRATKPAAIADVQIFHKAVDWALRFDEFFDAKQVVSAKNQLALGTQRANELRDGKPSWDSATGLVVRGYTSKIDGSVQPYGLVIPDDWKPGEDKPRRLDFWLHGRGEKLSELSFIEDRLKNKGEFTPEGAIVCHLYGRFCNANKFAGETDLFEALADIKTHYKVDDQRLVVRGFSMGGASCWQFATHHSGMWAACAPGAGFAETAEFFHVFAPGKTPPPWYEQVLWRWYDCTTMVGNLANTKLVAYSGEIDGQKQAADIMTRFGKEEGIEFPHIIGPQTAHKYHPDAKPQIEEFVTAAANAGRDPYPKKMHFTTYSLIYPRTRRVIVTGMEKQWERADISVDRGDDGKVQVTTKNINEFILTPSSTPAPASVTIDGASVPSPAALSAPAGLAFVKKDGHWNGLTQAEIAARPPAAHKDPRLCGPIDHAFMSSFLFVRPTGKPLNAAVGAWSKSEMEHAIEFWRRVFRGEAPVKDDTAVTKEDIANNNLVLWGDPSSNAVLASMAVLGVRNGGHTGDPLGMPYQWSDKALEINGVKYDAAHHAPVLIFPNPLNPKKYVVLNSGPTFREDALLNNSDQTPKLPDWAIVNIDTPADGKWPGQIIDAGFFDERWALPKK